DDLNFLIIRTWPAVDFIRRDVERIVNDYGFDAISFPQIVTQHFIRHDYFRRIFHQARLKASGPEGGSWVFPFAVRIIVKDVRIKRDSQALTGAIRSR